MFRNIWKGKQGKKKSRQAMIARVQSRKQLGLRLESLEGRAMLSGTGVSTSTSDTATGGAAIASDPATHLAIFAPPMALAGSVVPVEVVALDANNQPTSDFTDTISLGSSDSTALVSIPTAQSTVIGSSAGTAVPLSYTFQSSNNGHQLFLLTFGANTSGPQTVTATDISDTAFRPATANTTVNTPAAATHFAVIIGPNVQVGSQTNVLVEALDANNRVVPNYEGTVTLSSSDTAATLNTNNGQLALPQTYTFTASDHGRHQFQVTFNTAGPQTTITADDSADSLTGTGTTNVNPPAVATHFAVWIPPTSLVGVPTTVSVLALDANNHIVPNYTGPVTFSVSNDPLATLPAGYTFQASDHGHTTFQVTFETDGPQTVTVEDANDVVTGSATTTVVPAPMATQFLVILPPSVPADVPVQGYVVALGADGRPVPNYTGTVAFTSSDTGATVPANYAFQLSDRGFHPFSVTFANTGSQSVTVTDTMTSTITGMASTTVTAAEVPTSLAIDAPQNAPLGVPVVVRVNVLDANGNPIPDFAGQISLTSADTAAKIVPLSTVLPGGLASNLFLVTFGTSGSQTLTAGDSADMLTTNVSVNVTQGLGGIFGPGGPGGLMGPAAPKGSAEASVRKS